MAEEYVLDTSRPQPRRSSGHPYRAAAQAPRRAATAVTQRSSSYSGKGMLTAELMAGFVIILIRLVADYTVNEDGSAKGTVAHPAGQYGPVAIAAGLIGSFFFLSLLAMGGGTRAKLAVLLGAAIILTLGVKSLAEIERVGGGFGAIGKVVVPPASGTLPSVFGDPGTPGPAASPAPLAAATNTVEQMAGSTGLTYLEPTSVKNIVTDIKSAAEQALRQIVPGGSTPIGEKVASIAGNILKKLGL